ncbi:hypothetical protein ACN38_g1059 [Penicillium nordicum]|uniref:Nephrocystin 3-like N-terminal domain-containing protein n=1 Tax=Penicillium nordicum TaxID=229535 RepID=A0A0M9WK68_9EURO|nr:hypothetical protein ACN38_g1059 [Penicillium nordicum]
MAFTHDDYTVAWICALPLEMAAAKLMLERVHAALYQPQTDHNAYTLGSVSGHHVVIACLPTGVYGITSAAIVLGQMLQTFPSLEFGLMVGIGGGVPSRKTDIRLGDVVVSTPTSASTFGGVIQYDYGKTLHDGSFQQTGSLNKPPRHLLTAISQMRSDDFLSDTLIEKTISDILEKHEKVQDQFSRPENDWLFKPSYNHLRSEDTDCSACDHTQLHVRNPRDSKKPIIHHGLIASGNQVMKDPKTRDALAQGRDILCFEMEAAGLMDQLPCLVIRGICDYCDSHKSKQWQGYAALTAAAYTKRLLGVLPEYDDASGSGKGPAYHIAPSPNDLERIKGILQPSVHPLDTYQNIAKRRVPGTGDWVRNELLFQTWVETDDTPLLWVSGSPGCGKSFIAENVISYVQELFPQRANRRNQTSVGYFFFKHIDPETRNFHRALRDIAFQIYQNDPSYRDYIHAHCHSSDDIKSIQAAWRVLFMNYYLNPLEEVGGNVIIVLDGVDEAFEEDRREFLSLVVDIVHHPIKSRIKAVLLGRPEIYDDLVEALDLPISTIHVNADKNIEDITTYVRKGIRKSRSISRVPKLQRLSIEKDLIDKAQGMFLWADLMLTELNRRTRASTMFESLHKAPKGLDAMLKHVLETFSSRLNEEEATELNIILGWVACSDRPLTLRQVDEILSVELQTNDDTLGLEDALRTQYASLFVLNREDGLTTADLVSGGRNSLTQPQEDGPVENSDSSSEQEQAFNSDKFRTKVVFCHASIGDYLRNPGYGKVAAGGDSTPTGVDIVQMSVRALNICLAQIANGDGPLPPSFLRYYALDEWVSHLNHVCKYLDQIDQQQKQETIVLLCRILMCPNLEEMFHTGASPYPVILFIDRQTIDLIVSLLADHECVNTIDDIEMQEWIRVCIQEPAQIFVSLGREVASRWLIDSWDPEFCMSAVWAIFILLNGDKSHDLLNPPPTSVDTVLEVARWAQFEENARWNHHVGACLNRLGHDDAAIQYLNTALALEPIWSAKRDLAEVFKRQGRLNDSLRLLRESEAQYTQLLAGHVTKYKARDLSELRNNLGLLHIQLGDYSNATHWFMASIELWDLVNISDAVSHILRVLVTTRNSQYERIMQVLKKVDRIWRLGDTNFLFWIFRQHATRDNAFPLIVAVSAKRCNNLHWLESKYQGAIAERNMQLASLNDICFMESLAYLYDKFLGEGEKAIQIWKGIIVQHRVPDSLEYEVFCRARNRAVAAYAYRLLANSLRETGNSQALIVQELEKVCDNEIKSLSSDRAVFDGQPGIYMGVWHTLNGREQEAREYFRPYVLRAVSFGDEGNHIYYVIEARHILGHLLAMIGDDKDAIAILQLVHSPFTTRYGTSASAEERMASPWPLVVDYVWYCHICGRSWGNFVNCNICRRCNADICEECLGDLKTGGGESHACDAIHEWLNIPPPPGVPGTYQLSRDGQVLSVEEYFAAIKRSWM